MTIDITIGEDTQNIKFDIDGVYGHHVGPDNPPTPDDPSFLRYVYRDLSIIEFAYPTVSSSGGVVRPTLRYSVKRYKLFNNGNEQFDGTIELNAGVDGIVVQYIGSGVNPATGEVTVGAWLNPAEHTVMNVQVKVTVQSSSSPEVAAMVATITQSGYSNPYEIVAQYEENLRISTFDLTNDPMPAGGGTATPIVKVKFDRVIEYKNGSRIVETKTEDVSKVNHQFSVVSSDYGVTCNSDTGIATVLPIPHSVQSMVSVGTLRVSAWLASQQAAAHKDKDIYQLPYVAPAQVYHGCTATPPVTAEDLVGADTTSVNEEVTINFEAETKSYWVAIPNNVRIVAWIETLLNSNVDYVNGGTVYVNGKYYNIYHSTLGIKHGTPQYARLKIL